MTITPDETDHSDVPVADVPRCAACGSALDDVAKMTDMQVLEAMRTEFYRTLYRNLRSGEANHQEQAIVRGILRDNKVLAEDGGGDPEDTPRRRGSPRPGSSETYEFTPRQFEETEGG